MVTNCEFCAFYVYDDDGYAECDVNLALIIDWQINLLNHNLLLLPQHLEQNHKNLSTVSYTHLDVYKRQFPA